MTKAFSSVCVSNATTEVILRELGQFFGWQCIAFWELALPPLRHTGLEHSFLNSLNYFMVSKKNIFVCDTRRFASPLKLIDEPRIESMWSGVWSLGLQWELGVWNHRVGESSAWTLWGSPSAHPAFWAMFPSLGFVGSFCRRIVVFLVLKVDLRVPQCLLPLNLWAIKTLVLFLVRYFTSVLWLLIFCMWA